MKFVITAPVTRVVRLGTQGPSGPAGADGEQGPAGEDGAQGPPGIDGADGADGIDGAQGPQGIQGPTGPTGAQGPKGDTGDTGPTGPTGATGATGPSTTLNTTAPLTIDGGSSAVLNAPRTLAINAASGSAPGSMSAADFTKLAGVETGAQVTSAARVVTALASAPTDVAFNSKKLTSVANPTSAQDAATKAFIESLVPATVLPSQIADLDTWVHGAAGLALSGANVDGWTSQGAIATVFGNTGSNRPTFIASNSDFNGHPTVRFASASSQYLFDPTVTLAQLLDGSQQITAITVAKRVVGTNVCAWCIGNTGSVADTIAQHVQNVSGGREYIFRRDTTPGGQAVPTGTQTDFTAVSIYAYIWNGSYNYSYVNGRESINALNNGAPVCDRVYLGLFRASGANSSFYNGDIAEHMFFRRALTPREFTLVHEYLRRKYLAY